MEIYELKLSKILQSTDRKQEFMLELCEIIDKAADSFSEVFLTYITSESLELIKSENDTIIHERMLKIMPRNILRKTFPGLLSFYLSYSRKCDLNFDDMSLYVLRVAYKAGNDTEKILFDFFHNNMPVMNRFSKTIAWLFENSRVYSVFFGSEAYTMQTLVDCNKKRVCKDLRDYIRPFLEQEICDFFDFCDNPEARKSKERYVPVFTETKDIMDQIFSGSGNSVESKFIEYRFLEGSQIGIISKVTMIQILRDIANIQEIDSIEFLVLYFMIDIHGALEYLSKNQKIILMIFQCAESDILKNFIEVRLRAVGCSQLGLGSSDQILIKLQIIEPFILPGISDRTNMCDLKDYSKMTEENKYKLWLGSVRDIIHKLRLRKDPEMFDLAEYFGKRSRIHGGDIPGHDQSDAGNLLGSQMAKTDDRMSHKLDETMTIDAKHPSDFSHSQDNITSLNSITQTKNNETPSNQFVFGISGRAKDVAHSVRCISHSSGFNDLTNGLSIFLSPQQQPVRRLSIRESSSYNISWVLIERSIRSLKPFSDLNSLKLFFEIFHGLDNTLELLKPPLQVLFRICQNEVVPRKQLTYIFDQLLYVDSDDTEVRSMIFMIFACIMRQYKIQDDYIANKIDQDSRIANEKKMEQNFATLLGHKLISEDSPLYNLLKEGNSTDNALSKANTNLNIIENYIIDDYVICKQDVEEYNKQNVHVLAAGLSDEILERKSHSEEVYQLFLLIIIIKNTGIFFSKRAQDSGLIEYWIDKFTKEMSVETDRSVNCALWIDLLTVIVQNFQLRKSLFADILAFAVKQIGNTLYDTLTIFENLVRIDRYYAHYLIFHTDMVNAEKYQKIYARLFINAEANIDGPEKSVGLKRPQEQNTWFDIVED